MDRYGNAWRGVQAQQYIKKQVWELDEKNEKKICQGESYNQNTGPPECVAISSINNQIKILIRVQNTGLASEFDDDHRKRKKTNKFLYLGNTNVNFFQLVTVMMSILK